MPIVADAAVAVRADLSKFKNDLKGADKEVKGLGSRLSGLMTPSNLVKGFAGGILVGEVSQFMSDAVNGAAEYEDAVSAIGVIFGEEMIPQMKEWGDEAAANFGASNTDAIKAANVIATLGKSAGKTGQDLVDFSTEMVQLGGDLASMFGGTTQDAITAVGAALRGESEPIRRYGVLLDDATLRQKAFEMGLISTTANALTPQQRVLAAQASIMEQTSDAQGDFARTSDGMANTQRRLSAELSNLQGVIGEKLLPIALKFVNFVSDVGIPVFETLITVFGALLTPIGWVVDGIGLLGDVIGAVVSAVSDDADEFEGSMTQVGNAVAINMGGVPSTIRAAIPEVTAAMDEMGEMQIQSVRERFAPMRGAAFQTMVEYAKGLMDAQDQPRVQFEAMKQMQEDVLTEAQERAYLLGKLNGPALAAGLADGRPAVRAQAEATRLAILNRLSDLGILADQWGFNIASEFAGGINRGYGVVVDAAGNIAAAVRGQIGIESEPKDRTSPLHGITTWGPNIVRTVSEGILGSLGSASVAAGALASALVPSYLAGTGLAQNWEHSEGWKPSGNTYNLNVNGLNKVVGMRSDVLDGWDQLSRFGSVRSRG